MSKEMVNMDRGLFVAVLLMLGFGVVVVYSSSFALAEQVFKGSEFFVRRQMIRVIIALVGFAVFINVDYHIWSKLSNLGYVVAVLLLIAVLAQPDSHAVNGAKRWLPIGQIKFQVSEFARMVLILFISRHAAEGGNDIKNFRVYIKIVGMIAVICLLILFEPHFSASAIIGLIGVTMLFMAGVPLLHQLGLFFCAVPAAMAAALVMPHSKHRIVSFIHGQDRFQSLGYQAYQSIIGLGNGGLFGVGFGRGEQKYFFLPEPHTDFILSIIGEEIGFAGLMVLAAVFVFITYRGMKIALKAPDKTGQLMAFGFTFTIVLHALLHAAVAVGLMPTTGVSLPFISYGGMGLIFSVWGMGIVLNISGQSRFGVIDKSIQPAQRLSRIGL